MKKVLLFSMLFLFSVIGARAQEVSVYFTKGDVKTIAGEKSTPVKENEVIANGAELSIGKDGLVIVLQGEKVAVLSEAGTYTYDDLVKEIKGANTSLSSKYVTYIWQSAQKKEASDEMSVTGMVSRGGNTILYPTADSSIVITPSFNVKVEKESVPGTLFFYEKKRPLFAVSINDTIVSLYNKGLLEEREWFGLATSYDQNPPTTGIMFIRWASDSEQQTVTQEMQKLLVEIAEMPQEVQDRIITSYFESNNYVSNQTF